MLTILRLTLAAMMVAALPSCSFFGDDAAEVAADTAAPVRPVQEIRAIEVGRTWDGIMVTAFGLAPGLGYAEPRLEARRGGRPAPDGYLDFDFVATAPAPGFEMPRGRPEARIMRADRLIGINAARGVAGIRVHAASGGRAIAF